jgi:hypothetical protein
MGPLHRGRVNWQRRKVYFWLDLLSNRFYFPAIIAAANA